MTALATLRILASPSAAVDVRADRGVAERSTVVIANSRGDAIKAARGRSVDAAVVNSGEASAASTAAVLRGLGVTVWWIDAMGTPCPGSGAPALTSAWPDLAGFERLAELAARPGAGRIASRPLSVVVTTLNEGPDVSKVVAGITAQLGSDDELIVVDGGSTDTSIETAAKAWAHDPRIRFIVAPGAGISAGRNEGVRASHHRVIACTDIGCELESGWVEGLRRAFDADDRPGLVSGTYHPSGDSALAQAQAYACYPDPHEVARPDLLVRAYTRIFGTGFHPAYAVGRNVAFTRTAWAYAEGFREDLPTGEDVTFGLTVARRFRCVATADSAVSWAQRPDLRSTWRMYRGYGRASTSGGDLRLLLRDAVRGAAYLAAAAAFLHPSGRKLVAFGLGSYLTLPARRALRAKARPAVFALLPLALVTKDVGKLVGAVEGLRQRRKVRR